MGDEIAQSTVGHVRSSANDEWSPLGREVGAPLATRIWMGVLVVGIVTVGFLQQRVDPSQAFNADRYFVALAIVSASALALWATMRFVFRSATLPSVVGTAVFVLLFFRWPMFVGIAVQTGATGIVRDLVVVGVALVAVTTFVSRSRRRVVLGGAVTAVVLGMVGAVAPYVALATTDARPFEFVEVDAGDGPRNDVLVIVLDSYLREDLLLEVMGFDNSGFRDALEFRGFVVDDDAMSNYNRSYASIASMMALEPMVGAGDMTVGDQELIRFLLGGGGPLFGSYRDAGYEVTSYVTGWKGTRCSEFVDYCYRRDIVASTAWYLGEITPFAPILQSSVSRPITSLAIRQLRALADDVNEAFDRVASQFVWAHIELPHPPLVFDASCARQDDEWRKGYVLESEKAVIRLRSDAYTEQIQCVNRLVIEQIDKIIDSYADSQILIVSDHGPSNPPGGPGVGRWTRAERAGMLSVIAAVRGPSTCDDVDDARTLANTFRRFVACTLGADIELAADDQYVAPLLNNSGRVFQVQSPQP